MNPNFPLLKNVPDYPSDNQVQPHISHQMETLEQRLMLSSTPVAVDDFFAVTENESVTVKDLLANDYDADGDTLSILSNTTPAHGTLTDNGDGTFLYTPTAGYVGSDSFTYTNFDGSRGGVDTATVNLIINEPIDANAARNQLLAGVNSISKVGAPGNIAIFGDQAFGVMHDGEYQTMVAGAGMGEGRIIGFGHNGYVDFNSVGNSLDTGQLYLNSVEWTTGTTSKSIKIVTNKSGTRSWLQSQGYTNIVYSSSWQYQLSGASLVIVEVGRSLSQSQHDNLTDHVINGGGLITGGTGWGYQSLGSDLTTLEGNQFLRQAGLGWADNMRDGTTDATNRSTQFANAAEALAVIDNPSGYTNTQKDEAGTALKLALTVLPANDPFMLEITERFESRAELLFPTPSNPISDPIDQAVLQWESDLLRNTPAQDVVAHRTAEAVYGSIPVDAQRVTQQVTLDTTRSRWQATGLYAAPGDLVTITFPSSLVGKGYDIKINAHRDNIAGRSTWERMPYVHRSIEITSTTMEVASAFGGSIFIDFGGNAYSTPPNIGDVDITISGAIEQPYFVLGEHTDQQWNDELRDNPAPFAVLVSEHQMIVLPKDHVESVNLTQPTELMTWWNQVTALEDALANRLTPRTGAEITNVDVQISAGAAHSGYPIQAYEKHWGNLADLDKLKTKGSWGDFHELGHNHQRGWWTFSGDGEVTVNIFSNYALEMMASNPSGGWGYSADPALNIAHAINDVSGGGTYSSKSNRWSFWFQLADGFGWDTYKNVFRGYELDNANSSWKLPSTDQAEKDQWFTRWSNETGYDMKKFMVDTWGLQVGQTAINSVSHLPDWMPVIAQNDQVSVNPNGSVTFNVLNNDLAMDGVTTLTGYDTPTHGTLVDNGNGSFTYTPGTGFVESDSFTYTVASSAGNTVTATVTIAKPMPVAYWKLNEDTGTLTKEQISQTDGSLTNMNSSDWVNGRVGGALDFDGSNDYVDTNMDLSQWLGGTATMAFWIKTTQTGGSAGWSSPGITGTEVSGSGNDIQWGWINSSGRIRITAGDNNGAVSDNPINDGQWHHIAITRDAGTGLTQMYVDGQFNDGDYSDTGIKSSSFSDLGRVFDSAGTHAYFDGQLDEVLIYNAVLNGLEIELLANPVNHPPQANDDSATTSPGQLITIDVLANDTDPEGSTLSMLSYTQGEHGSVIMNRNHTLTYTPNPGFAGNDIFTYTMKDAIGFTDTATVTVNVLTLGDVNEDGIVNGFDVDPFVTLLLSGQYAATADMNGDGAVNGFDVDPFVEAVLGSNAAPAPVATQDSATTQEQNLQITENNSQTNWAEDGDDDVEEESVNVLATMPTLDIWAIS